jgi:Ca-activated chloride channel family protein
MDQDKRAVSALTKEDFEVYDGGKPQKVVSVDDKPGPVNAVVLLDTSGSMQNTFDVAARAIDEFLSRLSAEDTALVGGFNDKTTFKPDTGFTGSVDLLRAGLAQLPRGFPTGLYDALGQGIERLKSRQGRRVIVVMTDGEDNVSKLTAGDVTKRATAADVTVYAVGLVNEYIDQPSSVNMPPGARTPYPARRVRTSPDRGLKNLAAESGGGFVLLTKVEQWGPAFAAVAHELHGQYVIGFSPSTVDGKVHKLEVKVTKPGLTVRARKSYLAPAPVHR